jgi:hypothetical protein
VDYGRKDDQRAEGQEGGEEEELAHVESQPDSELVKVGEARAPQRVGLRRLATRL